MACVWARPHIFTFGVKGACAAKTRAEWVSKKTSIRLEEKPKYLVKGYRAGATCRYEKGLTLKAQSSESVVVGVVVHRVRFLDGEGVQVGVVVDVHRL